jgi:hypothetical protein
MYKTAALLSSLGVVALAANALDADALGRGIDKSPVAESAKQRVYFPSHCGNSKFRPRTIVVACGDAGFIIESINWSHWGSKSARGSGTGVTKTCVPDCASGGIEKHGVSISLFRVIGCKLNGRRQFTRLHYDFGSAGPTSGPSSGTQRFPCGSI